MIVCCEECETRFRLDEARIPERGARVRCSRCNHSFVVRVPASDADDEAAAEAIAMRAAQDSSAAGESGEGAGTTAEAPPPSKNADDDDDWEFGPSEAEVPGATASQESSAPEPEPEAESGDESSQSEVEFSDTGREPESALSDLLDTEDGVARATAAAVEAELPDPGLDPNHGDADAAPSLDQGEDPFGLSGSDLSGTGNLDADDRDFEVAAELASSSGSEAEEESDANADSLATLGDPSSWDLLSEDAEERAPSPPPPSSPPPAPSSASATDTDSDPLFPPTDLFSGAADRDTGTTPLPNTGGVDPLGGEVSAEGEMPRAPWVGALERGASLAAWPLTVILVAIAATRFLVPEPLEPATQRVGLDRGFEIHELESRVIENALGGPLLIVSGMLRNTGVQPLALESAVAVTLLGTEGQRFDEARVLMGPSPTAEALRELDPAHLQSQGDYSARHSAYQAFGPGEERPLSAVFERVPGGATRFSVGLQQIPAQVRRAPLIGPRRQALSPQGDGAAGPTESATGGEAAALVETATAFPSESLPSRE